MVFRYFSTVSAALLISDIPADPAGWWISEKYDGVRAIWTGTKLMSRNGNDLRAPAWFVAGLPDCRLDGELWMGRGRFDDLVSTIQRKDSNWEGVRYMVFDLADPSMPFEERNAILSILPPIGHLEAVNHRACKGHSDLDATEAAIVAAGGEGCVLRRPGHLYRPGRAGDVVKVKRLTKDVDRWQG